MARALSPFTRITLLITELNSNRVEDLADTTRCDLAHHTAKLIEDIEDAGQKEQARSIDAVGRDFLAAIRSGDSTNAATGHSQLIADCKRLKDLL